MRNSVNLKFVIAFSLITNSYFALAEQSDNSERRPVASSSAAPAINQSANTSQGANNSTATLSKVIGVANMGLGALKMKEFAASCAGAGATCQYGLLFQGILHFAMGAMSFKQSGSNSGAGYSANVSGIDTADWRNPYGDPNTGGGPGDSPTPYVPGTTDLTKDKAIVGNVNLGKFDEIRNQLTTSGIGGVKLDPKTGKIFDKNTGKTFDANKLGSAKEMADAGFSSADIAAATGGSSAAEKAAMKKLGMNGGGPEGIGAATAEAGFIDGGAGDSGTLSGKAGDVGSDSSGRGRGVASTGGMGKVASGQVAGLTKNFNGERIGVSAENIFDMMTRRYKTKEKQNSFFDPSERVKMPQ